MLGVIFKVILMDSSADITNLKSVLVYTFIYIHGVHG